MDFYKRGQLPVISISESDDTVSWESLYNVLVEHPANIVFFETDGKLSGIISQEEIRRAAERNLSSVPVKRNFLSLTKAEYGQAREILHQRERIHEIPVTDQDGRLLGMCTDSDDLLYLEYRNLWESNRYAEPFAKWVRCIYFILPPRSDLRRSRITREWISAFQKNGAVCRTIELTEVTSLPDDHFEWLMCPDPEMKAAVESILRFFSPKSQLAYKLITYRDIEYRMSSWSYGDLIQKMQQTGISVYSLYATKDESTEGRRRLNEGFRDWWKQPRAQSGFFYVLPNQAEEFYGEYYTPEYAQAVGMRCNEIVQSPVYCRLKDCQDPYFHVTNGERLTVGQPEEAEQTIWFFGPCLMIGTYVEDAHTIESFLQGILNKELKRPVRVVNCGCDETPYQEIIHLFSMPVKPNDIVVLFLDNRVFPGTHAIDLMELLDAHDVPSGWLMDSPLHCNHRVNRLIAEELFSRMTADGVLAPEVPPVSHTDSLLDAGFAMKALYLDTCLYDFHPQEGQVIGEVSMHGNPFTKGHRYLIETSARKVDLLFVILVEDEVSSYSFAERYAMAVDGTKDLPNVRVVPGGPFQGTRNVIAAYFTRSEPAAVEETAKAASKTYSEAIALPLHISYCFLGEEPNNPQSRAFGQLKKKYIAPYGIKAEFIPRLEAGGHPISATLARKAALEGDLDELRTNLPETTIRYLIGEFE